MFEVLDVDMHLCACEMKKAKEKESKAVEVFILVGLVQTYGLWEFYF